MLNVADPTESPKQWQAHVRLMCGGCGRPIETNASGVVICRNPECSEFAKAYHVELSLSELKISTEKN